MCVAKKMKKKKRQVMREEQVEELGSGEEAVEKTSQDKGKGKGKGKKKNSGRKDIL